MNSSENIKNAFEVVNKTYQSVNKFMLSCGSAAESSKQYVTAVPRFLRYKSDNDIDGWSINFFIMLYQDINDIELASGWRNGPVYVVEMNFECFPTAFISKFEYKDLSYWEKGCSPTSYWTFYYPRNNKNNKFDIINKDQYKISKPKTTKIEDDYWGLKKVVTYEEDLLNITSENIQEKIIDRFKWLKDK